MIDPRELQYGVNRWSESGIITADQARQILAFEKVGSDEPPQRSATHTSLVALFQDVRLFVQQNPGTCVVSDDDPVKCQLGWTASTPEGEHVEFTIALTRVKESTVGMPGDHPLRTLLMNAAGRAQIAERLSDPATTLL